MEIDKRQLIWRVVGIGQDQVSVNDVGLIVQPGVDGIVNILLPVPIKRFPVLPVPGFSLYFGKRRFRPLSGLPVSSDLWSALEHSGGRVPMSSFSYSCLHIQVRVKFKDLKEDDC